MESGKQSKPTVLLTYRYQDSPLSVANMFEEALRRQCTVYHYGEVNPNEVDIVFNTLADPGHPYPKGKLNIWWDIEACSYHRPDQYTDIVLAPYTYHVDQYPKDTFFFPFATDPKYWDRHDVPNQWEVAFIGREDLDRTKRVEYLDHLAQQNFKFLRANGVPRGPEVAKQLSASKIILQVSGDAGNVLETRFFETGLCGVIAADRTENNAQDLDDVAVADYHYISYTTKEEMVDKIAWMLEDDTAREAMRLRAYDNYINNHTYDVRVTQLLNHINGTTNLRRLRD